MTRLIHSLRNLCVILVISPQAFGSACNSSRSLLIFYILLKLATGTSYRFEIYNIEDRDIII